MAGKLNYSRWDSYDPDAEIERMEEEERQQQMKEIEKQTTAPATPGDFLEKFKKKEPLPNSRNTLPSPPTSNQPLRACSEDTLNAIAKELSLKPDLIKSVARAMFLTDDQVRSLPQEALVNVARMREGPEFEKVRYAIRRLAAEEQKEEAKNPKGKTGVRVKDDIPDDDPQVMTAMNAALRMTPEQIEGLPKLEKQAAIALRTDPKFAKARAKVQATLGLDDMEFDAGETRKKGDGVVPAKSPPKDPLWDGSSTKTISEINEGATFEEVLESVAAEAGFDPQLIRMVGQSMSMTKEEVESLPYDRREKVRMVREDAEFAPLRAAAAKTLEADAAIEKKLQAVAAEMGLDPEGIRACAQAMQMSEEEVQALKNDKEREAISGIRTGEPCEPIRAIVRSLGLGGFKPPPKGPSSTAKATPAPSPSPPAVPPPAADTPAKLQEEVTPAQPERVDNEDEEESEGTDPVRLDPDVLELAAQAMALSEDEMKALSPGVQANFRAVREDPEFEEVREAVQKMGLVQEAALQKGAPSPTPTPAPAPTRAPAPTATPTPSPTPTPAPGVQRPKWKLSQVSQEVEEGAEEDAVQQVVAKIELPLLESIKGMEVNLTDRQIYIHKPGIYELTLQLPYAVDEDSTQAKWLKKQRVLQVTMNRI